MISTSGILSTGEKKCRPMNCCGRALASARPVMGRVEVLEANTASGASCASACAVTSALTARSSNTASMTRSQPCSAAKSAVGDARQLRVALSRRAAALLHGLVEQALRVGLALLGGLQRGVQQHHLDAGLRRHVGDARAHHAGAQDAELAHRARRRIGRPRGALLDGVQLVPQRADQVREAALTTQAAK
jgi:hypothetical protein